MIVESQFDYNLLRNASLKRAEKDLQPAARNRLKATTNGVIDHIDVLHLKTTSTRSTRSTYIYAPPSVCAECCSTADLWTSTHASTTHFTTLGKMKAWVRTGVCPGLELNLLTAWLYMHWSVQFTVSPAVEPIDWTNCLRKNRLIGASSTWTQLKEEK